METSIISYPFAVPNFSEEFIEFIKNYNTQSRPEVMELLGRYSDKDIYIFTDRNEAADFLSLVEQ